MLATTAAAAGAAAAVGVYAAIHKSGIEESIQWENWDALRLTLLTDEGKQRARTKVYTHYNKANGNTDSVSALHLACFYGAPPDIMQSLMGISPNAISTISHPSQELPLHCYMYALLKQKTRLMKTKDAVIYASLNILIGAYPEGIRKKSSLLNNRQTPLHLACEFKLPCKIIKMLLDVDPNARLDLDLHEKSAYDIAMEHSSLWDVGWRYHVISLLEYDTAPDPIIVDNQNEDEDQGEEAASVESQVPVAVATLIQTYSGSAAPSSPPQVDIPSTPGSNTTADDVSVATTSIHAYVTEEAEPPTSGNERVHSSNRSSSSNYAMMTTVNDDQPQLPRDGIQREEHHYPWDRITTQREEHHPLGKILTMNDYLMCGGESWNDVWSDAFTKNFDHSLKSTISRCTTKMFGKSTTGHEKECVEQVPPTQSREPTPHSSSSSSPQIETRSPPPPPSVNPDYSTFIETRTTFAGSPQYEYQSTNNPHDDANDGGSGSGSGSEGEDHEFCIYKALTL